MAEIELSAMVRQCLGRRIATPFGPASGSGTRHRLTLQAQIWM